MEVKLRSNWFGPDGKLYRRAKNPHSFPTEFEKHLPSSAKTTKPAEPRKTLKLPVKGEE